jgi:Tfp pilus assembly protein PilX
MRNEDGLALLTVLMLIIILTVIGIASMTVSGLGGRMAGFGRVAETAAGAAESCLGTAVKIIQDTIDNGTIPGTYSPDPIPAANVATLQQEILGQSDLNPDAPTVSPNTQVTIGTFVVTGDIDRLYAVPRAGSAQVFAGGYDSGGGAGGGGIDILYRIDCISLNAATASSSRITAVYACVATGESCQRRI